MIETFAMIGVVTVIALLITLVINIVRWICPAVAKRLKGRKDMEYLPTRDIASILAEWIIESKANYGTTRDTTIFQISRTPRLLNKPLVTLKILTTRPGYLIGRGGEIMTKYEKRYKKEIPQIHRLEIYEIRHQDTLGNCVEYQRRELKRKEKRG